MDQEERESAVLHPSDASTAAAKAGEISGVGTELVEKIKTAELAEQIELLNTAYDELVAELQSSDQVEEGKA